MDWLKRIRPAGPTAGKSDRVNSVPEGLWKKCPKCASPLYRPELERNLDVCPKCGHHMRLVRRRLDLLDQEGNEIAADIEAIDSSSLKMSKNTKIVLLMHRKKQVRKMP